MIILKHAGIRTAHVNVNGIELKYQLRSVRKSSAASRDAAARFRREATRERELREAAEMRERELESTVRDLKRTIRCTTPVFENVDPQDSSTPDAKRQAAVAETIYAKLNPRMKADRNSADNASLKKLRGERDVALGELKEEQAKIAELRASSENVVANLEAQIDELQTSVVGLEHRAGLNHARAERASEKAKESAAEKKAREKELQAELRLLEASQHAAETEAIRTAEEMERVVEEHAANLAELEASSAARVREIETELEARVSELTTAKERLSTFKEMVGVRSDLLVPKPTEREGITDAVSHAESCKRSIENKHLVAVLADRDPWAIATAIKSAGGEELLKRLAEAPDFQFLVWHVIDAAASKMQEVWSARHSVHVMSDLSLSRNLFELLRHLLSYLYVPPAKDDEERGDYYERRVMWENPYNKRQRVLFPELAPRKPREADRNSFLGTCDLEQSIDGLSATRKDLVESIAGLVAHYWSAGALLETVTKGSEKLLLMGYGDATGGWRAASVTHFETGIGSWKNGRSASKVTLMPCHLYEGDDHGPNLRARARNVFDGWQKLITAAKLRFFPATDAPIQIVKEVSIAFRFAGDFQIVKSINNMSLYTSAIWCECEGKALNSFADKPLATWAEVETYLAKSARCVIKSLRRICQLNGYSFEMLLGRPYKAFDCGRACKKEHSWPTARRAGRPGSPRCRA